MDRSTIYNIAHLRMTKIMADKLRLKGTVAAQLIKMPESNLRLIARQAPTKDWVSTKPFAIPAPTTPPIWQWVVETGIAISLRLAIRTVTAAIHSTQKPRDEVIFPVLSDPMVMITLLPNIPSPREMPSPPKARIHMGMESVKYPTGF